MQSSNFSPDLLPLPPFRPEQASGSAFDLLLLPTLRRLLLFRPRIALPSGLSPPVLNKATGACTFNLSLQILRWILAPSDRFPPPLVEGFPCGIFPEDGPVLSDLIAGLEAGGNYLSPPLSGLGRGV